MEVVNEIIDLITGHRQNSSFVPTFERQRRGGSLFDRSAKHWFLHLCTESYLWWGD